MQGGIYYDLEANTALPPYYRINNKRWENENGSKQNPTPINISYSFGVTTLSLRFFNCSCIPQYNRNLVYKPVSSMN